MLGIYLSFSTAPETEVRWASRQRQISQGTPQVSSNITDVQRGASETGSASMQLLSPAQTLSGDSQRLRQEVTKFLDSVRAA